MNQYKFQEAHCSLFSEKRSFVVRDAAKNHRCMLDCKMINQKGETVVTGTAEIIAPTKKNFPSSREAIRGELA